VEDGRLGAHGWGGDSCACGGQPLAAKTQRGETGTPRSPTSDAAALPTTCRSCLARREWMDPFSARMLSVACRKMLWDKTLPDDEALALNRCLSSLSEMIGNHPQHTSWPDPSRERDPSRSTGSGGFSPSYYSSPPASESVVGGAEPPRDRTALTSTARPTGQNYHHPFIGVGASEASAGDPFRRLPPVVAVGVAALLAGVRRRQQLGAGALAGNREGSREASADHRHRGSQHSAEKRPGSAADESRTGGAGQPAKKVARVYPALSRPSESPLLHPAKGGRVGVDDEESAKASANPPQGGGADNVNMVAGGPVSEASAAKTTAAAAAAAAVVAGPNAA
ncbi:unnamed protein product, partial [Laminaria digitata]